MGARELKEAFNAVSEPVASCSQALLSYVRVNGGEFTEIAFSGNYKDGTSFSIRSQALPPGADVIVASRQTAESLLKQGSAS